MKFERPLKGSAQTWAWYTVLVGARPGPDCHTDEMDVGDAAAAVEEVDAATDDSHLPPGVQRSAVDPAALRFSLGRSARPNRGANIEFNVLNFGGRLGKAKRPRK